MTAWRPSLRWVGLLTTVTCTSIWVNGQQWEVFDMVTAGFPSVTVLDVTQDSAGTIWAATDWGLCGYDGQQWTILQEANSGLPDNYLRALAVDHEGHLWIGTTNSGIAIRTESGDWTYLRTDNSPLVIDAIQGITVDHRGWVWIATEAGLQCFTGEDWFLYDNTPESHLGYQFWGANVLATAVREDGLVALAMKNGGMTYISDDDFIYYTSAQDGFPDNSQNAAAFDSTGDRWLACPAGGLVRHAGPHIGGPWFQYNGFTAGLPDDTHTSIVIDGEDRKWVGTEIAGIIRFEGPGSWSTLNTTNSGLPDDHVLCLHLDQDGDLWVGTKFGGLARYRPFTGVNDGDAARAGIISVHPMPFSDRFMADLRALHGPVTWQLMDAAGRVLRKGRSTGGVIQEFLWPDLGPGLYLFVVNDRVSKGASRVIRSAP